MTNKSEKVNTQDWVFNCIKKLLYTAVTTVLFVEVIISLFVRENQVDLFSQASIDKKLYQNLNDVIIPLTLFFMVLYLIVKKGYPVLEKRYLFKRVIDRQYLILGKDTNPTDYEDHFYKDM